MSNNTDTFVENIAAPASAGVAPASGGPLRVFAGVRWGDYLGVAPFLISSSMLGAVSQRLVRKVCPKCAQGAAAPSEPVVNEFIKNMDPEEGRLVKELILKPGANYKVEKGCPECRNTGYMGRTGIFELMLMNEEIRKQILDHAPTDAIKRTAIKTGKMRTLLMDGILKARAGSTTLSEIIRVTATMV